MKIIKLTVLTLFLAVSQGMISAPAMAVSAAVASTSSVGETVAHIEKALVEINKSDFNTAQVHLKAARAAGEKITGNEAVIKQANALVIQGQIKTKLGDIKSASDELNKALALFNSVK